MTCTFAKTTRFFLVVVVSRLPLLSWVQRVLVDLPIVFRADGVQFSVVAECAPLSVDDHVWFRLVAVEQFSVLHLFDVTRVTTRSYIKNACHTDNRILGYPV